MPRLILSRPDRLGDVLITSSLIPILHKLWPGFELYWMVNQRFHPLFHQHPHLAGLIDKDHASNVIRALRAEAIIHFQPDPNLEKLSERVSIPQRIGYSGKWWTRSLTTVAEDDRPLGIKHEAEYSLDLARFVTGPTASQPLIWNLPLKPSLTPSPTAARSLAQKLEAGINLGEYVVINPTAHSEALRWPWERFLEISRWLVENYNLKTIVISGDASDISVVSLDKALSSEGIPHLNLAGQIELDEMAWLLKSARLHLARNTGTSHLAAAVDCPQVELFVRFHGRYSIGRWRALSSLSTIVHPEINRRVFEPNPVYWKRCASAISVEQVRKAVQSRLDSTSQPPSQSNASRTEIAGS